MMRFIVGVVVVCATASSAVAGNVRLDKDGLTAWVPDQWTVDRSNEGIVAATAPNQAASAIFMSQAIRDLELAYKNMPAVMRTLVPNIQFGTPTRVTIANASAIVIKGVGDISDQKIEANIATLITPGGRALYVITLVQGESAASFDATLRKIIYGLTPGLGGTQTQAPAAPAPPKTNPCWELKSQPNGWARNEWRGVSFLLPKGWTMSEAKDPNTDAAYLTITDRSSTIMLFTFAAAKHDGAWQALASQLPAYGLGDVAWGEVVGQRALCATGSASDGVVFHRSGTALAMLARAGGDPSNMRGILGSMRWK
jgi:hypothetical protein